MGGPSQAKNMGGPWRMVPVCFFRCHSANFGGYPAATTQQTWGVEFFYLHLGPGLAETDKFLSLATWPLVISAETMGRVGMIGSPFVITHNKIS